MRTIMVFAVSSVFVVVFALMAPPEGWSDRETVLGLLTIMIVVGGLGWHTNLFGHPRN